MAAKEQRWLDLAEKGSRGIATKEEVKELGELGTTLVFNLWHGRIIPKGIYSKLRRREKRREKVHGPMPEPDFSNLPPSLQNPAYRDIAIEAFHKMWGRAPTKRELFDELNNMTVIKGTDDILSEPDEHLEAEMKALGLAEAPSDAPPTADQSAKAEAPAPRAASSYPQTYGKLTVENSAWTQFRYDGVERLFDLGHRDQAAETVKVMLLDLKAWGRAKAKPEQTICKKAGIANGKIRSPFSDRSGDAPMFKDFFNLVIKNDGTRRGRYYLDIV